MAVVHPPAPPCSICEPPFPWRLLCRPVPPGLLFFTTYTLLVLFWAEIYHQARSMPTGSLRPIFIAFNALVYAIQVGWGPAGHGVWGWVCGEQRADAEERCRCCCVMPGAQRVCAPCSLPALVLPHAARLHAVLRLPYCFTFHTPCSPDPMHCCVAAACCPPLQGGLWALETLAQGDSAAHLSHMLSAAFLAAVSLAAAVGFLVYGGRLFLMLQRFPIESRGRKKKLREVGLVTAICAACFTLRCAGGWAEGGCACGRGTGHPAPCIRPLMVDGCSWEWVLTPLIAQQ
jgi:hypothetical protein